MVGLMERRRMMMQQAGIIVESALYPVGDIDYSPSSAHWVISGSHVTAVTSANSRNLYIATGHRGTSAGTNWGTWFTLNQSDTWELKVKNITYENSGSGSNSIEFSLYDINNTIVIDSQKINYGSGSGTVSDTVFSGTISDTTAIRAMRITIFRATDPLEFDIEFRVNGILYAIN